MTAVRRLAGRRPWILALLGYVLVVGVLLGPRIGPDRTVVPVDVIEAVQPYASASDGEIYNHLPSDAPLQFYPWMKFLDAELDRGHIPQWNPYILGGVPVTPNGFMSPYYPGFWLTRVLNAFDAYDAFVLVHLVLGAIGCYALARRLGARPLPAWIAGNLAFAALMWTHWSLHLVHLVGMAWLPLVLAAAHAAITQPTASRAVALGLTFGLWWLGANPQFSYFGTLALGVFVLGLLAIRLAGRDRIRNSIVAVAGGLVGGALLASPVLYPTATIAPDILRDREPVAAMAASHLPLEDFALLAVPEARGSATEGHLYRPYPEGALRLESPFVGVTTLVLVALAFVRRGRPERWLLLVMGAGIVLLAFTSWPHHLLHGLLPGYDRFRGSSRWLSVLPAVLIPLAALGLDRIAMLGRAARISASAAAAGAALAAALVVGDAARDPEAPHRFFAVVGVAAVVPAVLAGGAVFLARRRVTLAVAVVALAVAGEVVFHLPRWYPTLSQSESYPDVAVSRLAAANGGRVVRVGPYSQIPAFAADIPMAYGIADVHGWAVLFPRHTDRYLRLIDDYGTFARETNTAPPLRDPASATSALLDALDARTIVSDLPVDQPELASFGLLDAGPPAVYARPSPGPVAVVPSARPATPESVWESVADPTWDPSGSAAVVGLDAAIDGGPGTVRVEADTVDHQRYRVSAPAGGFLRVSGAWHPGWSARVDGQSVEVHRADGMFRGVALAPGDRRVEFRFENPQEMTGRAIGAAALTSMLLALLVPRATRSMRAERS